MFELDVSIMGWKYLQVDALTIRYRVFSLNFSIRIFYKLVKMIQTESRARNLLLSLVFASV